MRRSRTMYTLGRIAPGRLLASIVCSFLLLTISAIAQITVTSPNGGETLFAGDTVDITFTAPNTANVRVEYSLDGGLEWNTLTLQMAAYLGRLRWVVPNTVTTQALVRVVDRLNESVGDVSDRPFSIVRSSVQVLTPNGGVYAMNSAVTVIWSAQNATTLRIQYSRDNGASWIDVATVPASGFSYSFVPTPLPTKQGLVRIYNVDRPHVFDVSDVPFQILPAPSITVFSPATGMRLKRGTTHSIEFEAIGVNRVNISYSSDGGVTWGSPFVVNLAAGTGNYLWTVPNQLTSQGKIRVQETSGTVIGESGIFSIVDDTTPPPPPPTIHLDYPNGGESFTSGDRITIRWTSTNTTTVTLYYSTNGGTTWTQIQTGVPAAPGSFDWTAPNNPGTRYRVRVDASATVTDASDANFEVKRRLVPTITVVTPNGGEDLTVGDAYSITWTSADLSAATVDLSYSVDNGNNWRPINTVSAATASYDWTVPDSVTTVALVMVSETGTSVSDRSNSVFTISKPIPTSLRVVSPNTGEEIWREGTVDTVKWEASPDIARINIRFSVDGGFSWRDQFSGVPANQGLFPFIVPHLADTSIRSVLVQVVDAANQGTYDNADAPFGFIPKALGVEEEAVVGIRLSGAYPNPAPSTVELRWRQLRAAETEVRLYDGTGRMVSRVELGRVEGGEQRVSVSLEDLPAGSYVYEVRTGAGAARGLVLHTR